MIADTIKLSGLEGVRGHVDGESLYVVTQGVLKI